jgi:uncharacterized membrane protein YbhN (UPF0104 family)
MLIDSTVTGLLEATRVFSARLDTVEWTAVGLALACHAAKVLARTRAWRNIVAAAYPDAGIRWRDTVAAYVGGTGANAVLPARAGDALRLFLLRRKIEGATYATLAATLVVETAFDAVASSLLVAWALHAGVLPGLDVLPTLPAIAWVWPSGSPRLGAALGIAALAAGLVLGRLVSRRIRRLRRRLACGLAVVSQPRRYLCHVAGWQALSWIFRVLSVLLFLRAFGIDAGLTNALTVQTTESLATLVPLTPSGIGTEQALLAYVLRGEAPLADVVGFSVGMKLVLVTTNVLGAALVLLLTVRTLRWRRLAREARRPWTVEARHT